MHRSKNDIKCLMILITGFVFTSTTQSQVVDYLPVLETSISSKIEIGVETSGTKEIIFRTTSIQERNTSDKYTRNVVNTNISEIESTKKRYTNPKKRESRPKASGLFGGITRAIGGDPSGLVEWGGGFVDHMMEPRFNIDRSKTYFTKIGKSTKSTKNVNSSWANKTTFESSVIQKYQTDINKGFIKFSIEIKNVSERSVRIKYPSIMLHFVNQDEQLELIGPALPTNVFSENSQQDFLDTEISIGANGGKYTLSFIIENLNFLDIQEKYRLSKGLKVTLQDLLIITNDGEFSIPEIIDSYYDTHVRVDYFNGTTRSVRYFKVPNEGITYEEFFQTFFRKRNPIFNNDLNENDYLDKYILKVNHLESDTSRFLSKKSSEDKYNWKRWFINVANDLSIPLDPKLGDYLYPGYSIRVGYYSADQILPENIYEPVIYEKEVKLKTGEIIELDIDLKPGDFLKIDEVEYKGFNINVVEFDALRLNAQIAEQQIKNYYEASTSNNNPDVINLGQNSQSYNKSVNSIAQNLLSYNENHNKIIEQDDFKYYYYLEPNRITKEKIDPKKLFLIGNFDKKFALQDTAMKYGPEAFFLAALSNSFQYKTDFIENALDHQPVFYIETNVLASSLNEINDYLTKFIELEKGTNENFEDFVYRILLEKDEILTYQINEPIAARENKWIFAPSISHFKYISGTIIKTPSSDIDEVIKGFVFGNGINFSPIIIKRNLISEPLFLNPLSMSITTTTGWQLINNPMHPFVATAIENTTSTNKIDAFISLTSDSQRMPLFDDVGPEFIGKIKVIRYR